MDATAEREPFMAQARVLQASRILTPENVPLYSSKNFSLDKQSN